MTKTELNRRQLIKGVAYSLGALALRGYEVQAAASAHFSHGVASGDPLSDRVILWTRALAGDGSDQPLEVSWQVSRSSNFNSIVAEGLSRATAEADFTVKVDAKGLAANQSYFYRFISNGITSPVGQTRTLPVGDVSEFKIGVASCANYPQGYFNVYNDMTAADIDLVLHLGDYIYEYPEGEYANRTALSELGRHVIPENETLSLEDYRMRYGLYRNDVDLQACHQRHPFICVWDDHELADNTWKDGAVNHNRNEGSFSLRMRYARKAYHEWLPIRTPALTKGGDQGPIYRSFQIGKLADLIMLDTRLHGRDKQLDYRFDMVHQKGLFDVTDPEAPVFLAEDSAGVDLTENQRLVDLPYDTSGGKRVPVTDYNLIKKGTLYNLPPTWMYLPDPKRFMAQKINDPSRTLLGLDQEAWLEGELMDSKERGATWQILGQQVLMGKVFVPYFGDDMIKSARENPQRKQFIQVLRYLAENNLPFNLDAWDGYGSCRDRVQEFLLKQASNPVVLAGDTHNAWAFNMRSRNDEAVGIEVGAPGITSPGMESFLPARSEVIADMVKQVSSEVVDLDATRRGWAVLVLTPEQTTSQFRFVDTILSREYQVDVSEKLVCKKGSRQFS